MKQFAFLSVGITVCVLVSNLDARQRKPADPTSVVQQSKPGAASILASARTRKVGFRLPNWKTIHSDSTEESQLQIATLVKIGCEVKSENHGNHIDVRYRCVDWKTLKLTSDSLVDQWATWCQSKGMETVVIDPAATTKKPTVRFRLLNKKTVHLHQTEQANQIIGTLKLIGCQVASHNHGNHIDATYSCPSWKTIALPSEAKAHAWQAWLDESGFETAHTH